MGKWLDALLAETSPKREYTALEKRKKIRQLEWDRLLGDEQWSKIDSDLSLGEKFASAIEPVLEPMATGVANLQGVFNLGTAATGRLASGTDAWKEAKKLNEEAFEQMFKRKPETLMEKAQTEPGLGEVVFRPKEDDGPIESVLKNVGMLGLNIATDPLTYTPAGIGKAVSVASKLGTSAAKPKNVLGLAKIAMGEPLLKEAKEAFRAGQKLKGLGKSVQFTLGGTPAGMVYAPQLAQGLTGSVGQALTGEGWDEKLAGVLGTGIYGTFAFLGYKGVSDTVKEIKSKRIFESPKKLDRAIAEESARNAFLSAEVPPGFASDEYISKSMDNLGLSVQGWRDSVLKFAGEEFDKSYRGDASKKEAARAKYMQLHSSLIDSWIKERAGAEGKADKTVRSLLKVESKPEGTPIDSEIKRVIDLEHGDAIRSEMTGVLSRLTDFATGFRLEKMSRDGDTVAGAILAKNFKDAMRPVVGQDVTLPAIVERRAQRLMYENRNMTPAKAFQTALGEITDGLVSHYREGFDTSDVELSRAALQQKIQSEDLFGVSIPEASRASDLYGRSALAQFSREALGVQMRNAFPGLTEDVYGALDSLMDTIAVRQVDKYPDRYKTEADWYASTFDSIRRGGPEEAKRLLGMSPEGRDFMMIGEVGLGNLNAIQNRRQRKKALHGLSDRMKRVAGQTAWELPSEKLIPIEFAERILAAKDPAESLAVANEVVRDLAVMYPSLNNLEIQYKKLGSDRMAEYEGGKYPRIRIDPNKHPNTPRDLQNTLLHEIQHAIQDQEGWLMSDGAPGGGPNYIRELLRSYIAKDDYNPAGQKKLVAALRKIDNISAGKKQTLETEFIRDLLDSDSNLDNLYNEIEKDFLINSLANRIYRDSLIEVEARDSGARVTKADREIPPASVLDRWALFSGAEDGGTPVGAAEFLKDQRAIVWAFEQADASTAIHELSHVFLRQMERLGDPHMADVKRALGKAEADVLTRADHEMFAKAFEKHAMAGTSEFDERNELFAPFNAWLRANYPAMVLEIGREKISPNLKKAMDRIVLDGLATRIAKQRIAEANSAPDKRGIVQAGPIMKALKDNASMKERIESGTKLTEEAQQPITSPKTYRSVGDIKESIKRKRAAQNEWIERDRSEYSPPDNGEYVLFSDQSVSRAVESALDVRGDGQEAETKLRSLVHTAAEIQGQVPGFWTRTRKIIDSWKNWKYWPGMSVSVEGRTAPIIKSADKAGIDAALSDALDLAVRQPVDLERDLTVGTVKTDRFTLKPEYSGEAFPKELIHLTPEQGQDFTIIALAERGKETVAKILDRNAQYKQEKMMWREELDMAEEMLKLDPENEEIKKGIADLKKEEPKPPKSLDWNIEDARQYALAAENIRRRIGDDAYNAYLRSLDRLVDWSNRSVIDALVEVGYLSSTAAKKLRSYSKFAPITYADRLLEKATGVDPNSMERIMDAPGELGGAMETAEAVEAWLNDLGIPPEAADNSPSANVTKRRTSVSASTNRPILNVIDAALQRAAIAKGITARTRVTNIVPDLMVRGIITKRDPSHRLALSPEGAELALSNATPVKDQPVKRPMLIDVDGEMIHLKHDPEVAADLRSRHGGGKDDTVTVFYEMPVLAKDEKGKYIIDENTMQYVPMLDAEGKIITERVPVKMAVDKGVALSVSLINPRAANVTMGAAWEMVKGAADLYNKVVSKPILKKPAEIRRKVVTSLPGFALRQISPFRDPFNHWARNPKTFPYGKMVKGMASKMFLGKDVTPHFAEALRKIGATDLAEGIMREDILYRYAEDVSRKATHMGTVGEATILPDVTQSRRRIESADAPPASFLLGRREYLNRKGHFRDARDKFAKMGRALWEDITGLTAHAQDSPTRVASAMDVGRAALEGIDINDKAAVSRAMAEARGGMAAAHATSNLDFSNMAAFSNALNGMEMFASAKLVDTGAMMKAMRRNPVSFWTKVGVGVIVPGILEGLSTVDDTDEDNRSTVSQLLWAKFNVGDRYFYLPRHQGIFRPLNYAVREAVRNMAKADPNWRQTMYNTYISLGEGVPFMDYMVQSQEGDVSDYQGGGPIRGAASALGQLARTAAPVGVEPLVDIGFNERSFFGGAITPEYEKSQVYLEYRGDNRYSQGFRKLASHLNMDGYQLEYITRQYAGEYGKVSMRGRITPEPSMNLWWNPPDRPIGMRSKPYHDWMAADKAYASAKKQYKAMEDQPEAMQILARHPYLEDDEVEETFKEHNAYLKEVKTEIRELKKLPKTEENLAMIEELEAQMTYETLQRMAVLNMVNDGRYKGLFK